MEDREEKIIAVIKAILEEFQSVYCTPRYYGEHTNPVEKFTQGYCGIFALILKNIFEEGIFYYIGNDKMGHILLKIGNNFYDATGKVPSSFLNSGTLEELSSIYEVTNALPWDFLYDSEKTSYYDEMIDRCTLAGKYALNNFSNSKMKK